MFEDKDEESIHKDLLKNISDDYEKSTGYPTADITKAFAIEESKIYEILGEVIGMIDVDNLFDYELEKYVYQRKGISRLTGDYAKTQLTVNGNGIVVAGDKFQTPSGIQFACIDSSVTINGTGLVNIQCLQVGIMGMVGANSITQMPVTLQGITSCTNLQATTDGYEPETDAHLRQRYYEALRMPPTSGNKYHYLKWAKEVNGVGNAEVYPLWNGENTVKVVIIDVNSQPASLDLVDEVQEHIDPKGTYDESTNTWSTWGTGSGEAPIGAYCTVESAASKAITVKVKIEKSNSSYTDENIASNIIENITSYFKEIALNKEMNYVSYAKIGHLIFASEGVADYDSNSLTVNDTTSNIILSYDKNLTEIPIVSQVVLLQ